MRSWLVVLSTACGALIGLGAASSACVASPDLASRPDASRSSYVMQCDGGAAPLTKPSAKFTDLYAQLFSATGAARCADQSCHGGDVGQGGLALGTDQRGCYEGFLKYGLINPSDAGVADAGVDADTEVPDTVVGLVSIVSPLSNGGAPKMPRPVCGARALDKTEIEQIRKWGLNGAAND